MKTIVCIEVRHNRPIPELANLIAGRVWTIQGVTGAEPMIPEPPPVDEHYLRRLGFSEQEIALGKVEVIRG